MNKNELKNTLKPLIKECIKEVILEEGILSGIVSEVLRGAQAAGAGTIVESRQASPQNAETQRVQEFREREQAEKERKRKILDSREKMSKAIGRGAFNGTDLFEGTEPLSSGGSPAASPSSPGALAGVAPNDPGVDISTLFGSKSWGKMV